MDSKSQLIVEFETNTACLHDSRVSLAREGDRYAGIKATLGVMICPWARLITCRRRRGTSLSTSTRL
ncbi:hypothetical protein [Methanocella conradii]|uniref:hypothetical protein n=1 Tax=Methanocella conradii TaxID=1175444 RepID=UPI0020C65773|nr:hypothetical protein [Methanocella conradii]